MIEFNRQERPEPNFAFFAFSCGWFNCSALPNFNKSESLFFRPKVVTFQAAFLSSHSPRVRQG